MQVLIDIHDNKADYVPEWLKKHSYVKIKAIVDKKVVKAQLLADLEDAADFMKLVNEGKAEGKPAKELLDEL